MTRTHDYNLSVADVAEHLALSPRAVRGYLQDGRLRGARMGGTLRCRWADVWMLERGSMPRGNREAAYQDALLTKMQVAARWNVSIRTVERWINSGLPTRNVGKNVRIAPIDLKRWTDRQFGLAEV